MSPTILFAPDCGDRIGGGHVMRCLTLAGVLQERGACCSFLVGSAGRRLVAAYAPRGIEALEVDAADTPVGVGRDFASVGDETDIVVVDNYRVGAAQETALRSGAAKVVVIDDLADRRHDCDLLIDASFERKAADYAGLVPPRAKRLTGIEYALVRPGFAALRQEAHSRRDGRPVRRVLVSLGLTDLGGVTVRVVRAMLPVLGDAVLDVVVGGGAASLDPLAGIARFDSRVRLHVDTRKMERLTLEADLAIGAGGSSTWERACLGLPAVSLVLADNQRRQALRLDERGLTLAVEAARAEFPDSLVEAWGRLAGDAELRSAMSRRNFELCDGGGAARAADAILALVGA